MQTGFTTLWVADHHLLQTHTCALQRIKDDDTLDLKGVFKTISQGRDRGNPNCFLFPLPDGGWRVFRFSPGIAEAETWNQDDNGWTTCYFNRYPSLAAACKMLGGIEDEDGGYVFDDAETAGKAGAALGQTLDLKNVPAGRKIAIKSHKDGRLVIKIERKKDDPALPGWLEKKTKWLRIYNVDTDAKDEDQDTGKFDGKFDGIIRCLETAAKEQTGWVVKKNGEWVHQSGTNVRPPHGASATPRTNAKKSWVGSSWSVGD